MIPIIIVNMYNIYMSTANYSDAYFIQSNTPSFPKTLVTRPVYILYMLTMISTITVNIYNI